MRNIASQLTKDRVVAELRKAILYGNFRVGEKLYQDKIAEDLGVSRLPVREALQILHNEGLITMQPNKVAFVNEVSSKFLRDYYDVRILLEREGIRLAFQNHIDVEPLWQLQREAEKVIAKGAFQSFDDYNQGIHGYLWKASGNIVLERQLSQMWTTVISDEGHAPENMLKAHDDHGKIIRALADGDAQAAMDAIESHIKRSYQRILVQSDSQPDE